jgi:Protein of unknown function (DUF2934)
MPGFLKKNSGAKHRDHADEAVQVIYAHLPPAAILAAEQHLRVQTQIVQRAQELWSTSGARPGDALSDWVKAERQVVQKLCNALLYRKIPDFGPTPA